MDETLNQARNMLANHAMTDLIDATHNLIERYSVAGAKIYLEAQLQKTHGKTILLSATHKPAINFQPTAGHNPPLIPPRRTTAGTCAAAVKKVKPSKTRRQKIIEVRRIVL